jgi:hypothetical protein
MTDIEKLENKILDIIGEFGDQPEQCLSIIGEWIGEAQHIRQHGTLGRSDE